MVALGETYPQYGFARHKGYGTALHTTRYAVTAPAAAPLQLRAGRRTSGR